MGNNLIATESSTAFISAAFCSFTITPKSLTFTFHSHSSLQFFYSYSLLNIYIYTHTHQIVYFFTSLCSFFLTYFLQFYTYCASNFFCIFPMPSMSHPKRPTSSPLSSSSSSSTPPWKYEDGIYKIGNFHYNMY